MYRQESDAQGMKAVIIHAAKALGMVNVVTNGWLSSGSTVMMKRRRTLPIKRDWQTIKRCRSGGGDNLASFSQFSFRNQITCCAWSGRSVGKSPLHQGLWRTLLVASFSRRYYSVDRDSRWLRLAKEKSRSAGEAADGGSERSCVASGIHAQRHKLLSTHPSHNVDLPAGVYRNFS